MAPWRIHIGLVNRWDKKQVEDLKLMVLLLCVRESMHMYCNAVRDVKYA